MKDGWSFGFFPVFGYDSNTGTKYGGILKLFLDMVTDLPTPDMIRLLIFELSD